MTTVFLAHIQDLPIHKRTTVSLSQSRAQLFGSMPRDLDELLCFAEELVASEDTTQDEALNISILSGWNVTRSILLNLDWMLDTASNAHMCWESLSSNCYTAKVMHAGFISYDWTFSCGAYSDWTWKQQWQQTEEILFMHSSQKSPDLFNIAHVPHNSSLLSNHTWQLFATLREPLNYQPQGSTENHGAPLIIFICLPYCEETSYLLPFW